MNTKAKKVEISKLTNEYIGSFSSLMDEYRVFYGKKSNIDESRSYVNRLLKNDNVVFLIAVLTDEEAVGFCTLFKSYSSVKAVDIYVLNDLYVRKEYRKLGYSTELLNSAISIAQLEKVQFMKLETAKDNLVAQKLYENSGWKLAEFYSYDFEIKAE